MESPSATMGGRRSSCAAPAPDPASDQSHLSSGRRLLFPSQRDEARANSARRADRREMSAAVLGSALDVRVDLRCLVGVLDTLNDVTTSQERVLSRSGMGAVLVMLGRMLLIVCGQAQLRRRLSVVVCGFLCHEVSSPTGMCRERLDTGRLAIKSRSVWHLASRPI